MAASGVGLPGLHQGLVPGQGMSHSLGQYKVLNHVKFSVKRYKDLIGCFFIIFLGFGGRGVLPGVATGTGLSPKSSMIIKQGVMLC